MIEVRTEKVGTETVFGKIIKLVEDAENRKAPIQKLSDRLATWLVQFAIGFAALGARLALVARSKAELDLAHIEIEQHGGNALRIRGDVVDPEQMAVAVDRVPLHPEASRQLDPQGGVVEHPGRLLDSEDFPPVEGPPPAVLTANLIRHQDVGVELRVAGPRRGVAGQVGVDMRMLDSLLDLFEEQRVRAPQERNRSAVVQ